MNGGATRRHMPQRGPSSLTTNLLKSFSPQTPHRIPDKGATCCRHSSQTGKVEILVSEDWQTRQSAGNKTEKRLSAAVWNIHCGPPRNFARPGETVRVRSPLLLKTTLLAKASAGVANASIALFLISLQRAVLLLYLLLLRAEGQGLKAKGPICNY